MVGGTRTLMIRDPLDRWIRLTLLSEIYGEPTSTLRDLVKEGSLKAKFRGKLIFLNERAYQDYLESLPDTPDGNTEEQGRGNTRDEERWADEVSRPSQRLPRLRLVDGDQAGRAS